MSSFIVSFQIQADPPKRLDKALSRDVPEDADISRSQIVRFLEKGAVTVDGVVQSDVKAKISEGQLVEITVPEAVASETLAQDIPLDVIYEDQDLIVVNKPAGMVVHPAPGSPDQTLVNALLFHCADSLSGIGGERRPGIVHRIDKEREYYESVDASCAPQNGSSATGGRMLAGNWTHPPNSRAYGACWAWIGR